MHAYLYVVCMVPRCSRLLAADTLRKEAEHKLAEATVELRQLEEDCEVLRAQLRAAQAVQADLRASVEETGVELQEALLARTCAEDEAMQVRAWPLSCMHLHLPAYAHSAQHDRQSM